MARVTSARHARIRHGRSWRWRGGRASIWPTNSGGGISSAGTPQGLKRRPRLALASSVARTRCLTDCASAAARCRTIHSLIYARRQLQALVRRASVACSRGTHVVPPRRARPGLVPARESLLVLPKSETPCRRLDYPRCVWAQHVLRWNAPQRERAWPCAVASSRSAHVLALEAPRSHRGDDRRGS